MPELLIKTDVTLPEKKERKTAHTKDQMKRMSTTSTCKWKPRK
jgi:hypothetical protein